MRAHRREGEVGPQAGLGPAIPLNHEQALAQRLPGEIEQKIQRLNHGRVQAVGLHRLERRADSLESRDRDSRLESHPATSRIAPMRTESSLRGTVTCPGRSARQASLSATPEASRRPRSRSLMVTVPAATSSEPTITRRGAVALVGVLHLRPHAGAAEIDLGGDPRGAQLGRHRQVVAHQTAIERQHHHRAARLGGRLAQARQRRHQPRDSEGEAGGRRPLAGEAGYQVVVAAAAAHRPERAPPLACSSASNTAPV